MNITVTVLLPGVSVTGELYDPSRLRANLLAEYRPQGSELGLIFGGRGLFRENFIGFGVKYHPK